MDFIVLSLGSNLGEREQHLQQAGELLEKAYIRIQQGSSVYETQPFGIADQPDFLNQVLVVKTKLPPHFLLEKLLMIEKKMGRVRGQKNGPRIIDIDLLFYKNISIDEQDFLLPHPGLPDRRCVLQPMADLIPDAIHPLLNMSIRQLLDECPDQLIVKPCNGNSLAESRKNL
jgi:2-amino-4-hydroxy-6-hydroxymethyldihydropteridine diphosphokinase